MIRTAPGEAPGDSVSLVLLPHRSLTRTGLVAFLVGQGCVAGGYALLAALGGNVFAPVFAVLVVAAVGWCLARVWCRSATGQVVTLTRAEFEVAATSGADPARFHPYWVRVRLERGAWRGWPSRLLVGSHGQEVEVGAFLNEAERQLLARRLTALLRVAKAGGGDRCEEE